MGKQNYKLKAKDLITTGIFTALFFVVIVVFAMVFSAVPLMVPFIVCFDGLAGGAIYFYLRLKVQKFGAITIMSAIIGLILCLAGHFWPCIIFGVVFGLLADFISSRGGYKKPGWNTAGYVALMLGIALDGYTPMLFFQDEFRETRLDMGMTPEFIEQILAILRGPLLIAAFGGAAICAVIGALIGNALVRKHFVKAGLL
jgi:energy-coupling factor transport system substrate-specific component